jgi:transcriptional regulator with XRE-family HTH domain
MTTQYYPYFLIDISSLLWKRALAQRVSTRQATIADLERGAQKETSTALIRRLAKVLGVTSDWLIGMYEEDDQGDGEPAGMALGGA